MATRGRSVEERNALVLEHLGLVRTIAERVAMTLPESIDVDDLTGSGFLGLLDAAVKYDPERGVRFPTYAAKRIRGEMLDELRRNDWVPRMIRTKANRLEKATTALASDLRREPTDEEMAARLKLSAEKYAELLKELDVVRQISIEGHTTDRRGEEADHLRVEMLSDPKAGQARARVERLESIAWRVRGLTPNERGAVLLYHLADLTMKEVALLFGLSESRICQIYAQAVGEARRRQGDE